MHNGEIVMFSKDFGKLERFSILLGYKTGKILYVSSKEEFDKNKHI